MVNKYGLKMVGLRKIATDSKRLPGYYGDNYIQVNYNIATGETWGDEHVGFGFNSWTHYEDSNIINCGNLCRSATMQEIADMVKCALSIKEV